MNPSASKADLLLACSYPFAPDVHAPRQEAGPEAIFGTETHGHYAGFMTKTVNPYRGGDEASYNLAREAYLATVRWLSGGNVWAADLTERKLGIELPIAYDVEADTARQCEPAREEDHVYPDVDYARELPGTTDVLVIPPGGLKGKRAESLKDAVAQFEKFQKGSLQKTGVVLDLKTGMGPFRPEEMAQLWVLGLAASRLYKFDSVILGVVHAHLGGVPAIYASYKLGPIALRNFRKKLIKAWRRRFDGTLRPGPHCEGLYCPAYAVCPTKANALVSLGVPKGLTHPIASGRDLTLPGSPEEVGLAHQTMAVYEKLADSVKEWMRMSVRINGTAIRPDGKPVSFTEFDREDISKTSIEAGLGKVEGAREIERLRKKGCFKVTRVQQLRAGKAE